MTLDEAIHRALSLPIWRDPQDAQALSGGITNHNIRLSDAGRDYVVRVGGDIPVHQVMRFNELACHRAAHAVGLSPAIVHAEPGILAMDFVPGRALTEADIRDPETLVRVLPLIKRLHREGTRQLRGPVLMFWVFHVVRDYAATLRDAGSPHVPSLPEFLEIAEALEAAVGPVEVVLGHNDLLPANLLDAGDRMWLIDWDYGGLNSPLFDLAGLASNAGLDAAQERGLLADYYGKPADDALWRAYAAMKCGSLLRETMWSMVSELHSEIDFDYAAYTAENRARLAAALKDFERL
ncbi:phosphotransferase [Salipiger abyssi]|uniref:phosphotransferase n=1 Tax=Salipiger abyssi TaxID=1250539 RepID=UPI001A8D9153|nr:phosphotransferase [Salipiger abyssi]MBN9886313.1 phosphotransferase [Salipiger abyssi]